jgi:hypothetical protein
VTGEYGFQGLIADGTRILAMQGSQRSELLWSRVEDPSRFTRIAEGTGEFSLCWTPGGEIVYSSIEAGTFDLYVLDPQSQARRQLTLDRSGSEVEPAASPDGRYVVFAGPESSLWRINTDGTGLQKLTAVVAEIPWLTRPQISPDSRWVLYYRRRCHGHGQRVARGRPPSLGVRVRRWLVAEWEPSGVPLSDGRGTWL